MRNAIKSVVIALMGTLGTVSAFAHDFDVENEDGILLFFDVLTDNTCALTHASNVPLWKYKDSDITVPATVARDGKQYTVVGIADNAFYYCPDVKTVNLPTTITYVGEKAFYKCEALASLYLPNVTEIGESAFYACTSLESIELSPMLKVIPDKAFGGCKLSEFRMPPMLESIGEKAFAGCPFTSLEFSEYGNLKSIGNSAFDHCTNLKIVELPNTVTELGEYAFEYCWNLEYVHLPNKITAIPNGLVYDCSRLESIEIPRTVTSVGENAFRNCDNLAEIFAKPQTPPTCSSDAFGWGLPERVKLYVPMSSVEAYKSAEGWKEFQNIEGKDYPDEPNESDLLEMLMARIHVMINEADYIYYELETGHLEGMEDRINALEYAYYDVFGMFMENIEQLSEEDQMRCKGELDYVWYRISELREKYYSLLAGIDDITVPDETKEIYNLNGQRVVNPTRGIHIVNGRKVFINN